MHRLDPGLFIGNQPWLGVTGDPIDGTHNGHITDPDARKRRAAKKIRHTNNKAAKAEANKRRWSK